MKIFYKFFVAATEKNFTWSFNFQLPQYKRGIIVVDTEVVHVHGGFFSTGWRPLSWRCHGDIKSPIGPMSRPWCQTNIANWHPHVFHLQYISNAMTMSRAMSLRHRYNTRLSTRLDQLLFLQGFEVLILRKGHIVP